MNDAFTSCWYNSVPNTVLFCEEVQENKATIGSEGALLLRDRYKRYIRYGHCRDSDGFRYIIVAIRIGDEYVSTIAMDNISFTVLLSSTQTAAVSIVLMDTHAGENLNREGQWWILTEISQSPMLRSKLERKECMSGLCIPPKLFDTAGDAVSARTVAAQRERRQLSAWLGITRLSINGLLSFRYWLSWVALTPETLAKSAVLFIMSMREFASIDRIITIAARPRMHPRFFTDALMFCADCICDEETLFASLKGTPSLWPVCNKALAAAVFYETRLPLHVRRAALRSSDTRIVVQAAQSTPEGVLHETKQLAFSTMLRSSDELHAGMFPFDTFVLLRILIARGQYTWAKFAGRLVSVTSTHRPTADERAALSRWLVLCAHSLVHDSDWDAFALNILESEENQINIHSFEMCTAWFPQSFVEEALQLRPLSISVELFLSILRGRWINAEARNDFHRAVATGICTTSGAILDENSDVPVSELVERLAESNLCTYLNISHADFTGVACGRKDNTAVWNGVVKHGGPAAANLLTKLCGGTVYSLGMSRTITTGSRRRCTVMAVPVPGSPLRWVDTTLVRSVWLILAQYEQPAMPRQWIIPNARAGTFMAIASAHYRMSAFRMRTHTIAHNRCLANMCENELQVIQNGYSAPNELMRHLAAGFTKPEIVVGLWIASLTTERHILACGRCRKICGMLCARNAVVPVRLAIYCPRQFVDDSATAVRLSYPAGATVSHSALDRLHQSLKAFSAPMGQGTFPSAYTDTVDVTALSRGTPKTVSILFRNIPTWVHVRSFLPLIRLYMSKLVPLELADAIATAYVFISLPYLARSPALGALFKQVTRSTVFP